MIKHLAILGSELSACGKHRWIDDKRGHPQRLIDPARAGFLHEVNCRECERHPHYKHLVTLMSRAVVQAFTPIVRHKLEHAEYTNDEGTGEDTSGDS